MPITSRSNPAIRYVNSLSRASVRREEGAYLAEGVRLVHEALATHQSCSLVLYDPDSLYRSTPGAQLLVSIPTWAEHWLEVDDRALRAASQTESPAGVVAVLRQPSPGSLTAHDEDRCGLILDGISDPGNAGTIVRTAAAFGVGYVVSTVGSTDLFAPKVVRAGMGAHFRIPLYERVSWSSIVAALPTVELIAASAAEGELVGRLDWPPRISLIIGSEATGLSTEARSFVSRFVRIPMTGGVESLNAAVCAAILLFSALGGSVE